MKTRHRTGNGNTTRTRNVVEVQRGPSGTTGARSREYPRSTRSQSLSRSYSDWQPMGRELMSYPIDMLRRFRHDMDRLFEDMNPIRSERQSTLMSVWSPRTEMLEREGKFVIRIELPSVEKDDVRVTLSGDRLLVEGERRQKEEQQATGYYESEWTYGRFFREIPLPEAVDPGEVSASFNNGVLEITLPRMHNLPERREIPIRS
jgi:HSP20 family protein